MDAPPSEPKPTPPSPRPLAGYLDGTFGALVDAHAGRLFSIALRLVGDRRDAEEAAQDALVRAYRALEGYEAEQIRALRLRPWLTTIVLNTWRNRARVKRVPTAELVFEPAAEPADRSDGSTRREVGLVGAPGEHCHPLSARRSFCGTSTACRMPRWRRLSAAPKAP